MQQKQYRKNLLKYGSIAFEFMFTMLISAWIGIKLDKKFKFKLPVFLASFTIISIILNILNVIKKANKDRD